MYRKDCWPFYPTHLTEIIPLETLQVLESGSCERIKRPLTILDRQPGTNSFTRIEAITQKQRYEDFCSQLRSFPACELMCQATDNDQAELSFNRFQITGERYREFHCHMNLIDHTCLIMIHKIPVALAYSGQFCPPEGAAQVQQAVREISENPSTGIDAATSQQLIEATHRLMANPADARLRLEKEAEHIQRIATTEYERQKREWEEEFLDELRLVTNGGESTNWSQLTASVNNILEKIKSFCRAGYIVFFGSVLANDYLLAPIAHTGVPADIMQELPHFNWRKAGLPVNHFDLTEWLGQASQSEARERGIRGAHSDFFLSAACLLPISLSDQFRGVFVIGPFAEPVDILAERRFLADLANTAGNFILSGLQVLFLQQEQHRWESTARLLTHQVRSALTPINTQVGRAKMLLDHKTGGLDTRSLKDLLNQTEDLVMNLARSAKQTLKGHIELAQPDDLIFQTYNLPVLVGNTASGFMEPAKERGVDIVPDNSIDYLPDADVDVARLTIALTNLLDNALKYSFGGTKIYIKAHTDPYEKIEQKRAFIEIDNLGYEIRQDELTSIFEQGTRGQSVYKVGRVGGTGYGLWEARAILKAHGGDIRAACTPTQKFTRDGRAFHVNFTLDIPLRQKQLLQGGKHAG